MKISTKGQYALEIVIDLAMYSDEEHLESLKHISERRKLSEKYLERIIKSLKKVNIVKSVRGAYGGYCLEKEPEDITVLEVLEASEGELAPVACLTAKSECSTGCEVCPTKGTWGMMWEKILEAAESVTIGEIADYAKRNASKTL